jgi:hypothetical protein
LDIATSEVENSTFGTLIIYFSIRTEGELFTIVIYCISEVKSPTFAVQELAMISTTCQMFAPMRGLAPAEQPESSCTLRSIFPALPRGQAGECQ